MAVRQSPWAGGTMGVLAQMVKSVRLAPEELSGITFVMWNSGYVRSVLIIAAVLITRPSVFVIFSKVTGTLSPLPNAFTLKFRTRRFLSGTFTQSCV